MSAHNRQSVTILLWVPTSIQIDSVEEYEERFFLHSQSLQPASASGVEQATESEYTQLRLRLTGANLSQVSISFLISQVLSQMYSAQFSELSHGEAHETFSEHGLQEHFHFYQKNQHTGLWKELSWRSRVAENRIRSGQEFWIKRYSSAQDMAKRTDQFQKQHSQAPAESLETQSLQARVLGTQIRPKKTTWTNAVSPDTLLDEFGEQLPELFDQITVPQPRQWGRMFLWIIPLFSGISFWVLTQNPYTLLLSAISPLMMIPSFFVSNRKDSQRLFRYVFRIFFQQKELLNRANPELYVMMNAIQKDPHSLWSRRQHDSITIRYGKAHQPDYAHLFSAGLKDQLRKTGWKFEDLTKFKAPARLKSFLRQMEHFMKPRQFPNIIQLGDQEIISVTIDDSRPSASQQQTLSRHASQLDELLWTEVSRLLLHVAMLYAPSQAQILNFAEDIAVPEWLNWLPHHQILKANQQQAVKRSVGLAHLDGFHLIIVTEKYIDVAEQVLRKQGLKGCIILVHQNIEHTPKFCSQEIIFSGTQRVIFKNKSESNTELHVQRPKSVKFLELKKWARVLAGCHENTSDNLQALKDEDGSNLLWSGQHGIVDMNLRPLSIEELHPNMLKSSTAIAKISPSSATTLSATVAKNFARKPILIDIAKDGPHMLIAGTTGSGKSEFLQSFLYVLAEKYSPQDFAMILVDFKGGATFAQLNSLIHSHGLVTDIHGHMPDRLFTLLEAELHRREKLFYQAGVQNYAEYRQLQGQKYDASTEHINRETVDEARQSLPRLLVCIDEYAALNDRYPNSQRVLEQIAARGRSLGFHLVLATQRPQGIVSAQLKANIGIKIVFRVRDQAESFLILDHAGAESLPSPTMGQAFLNIESEPSVLIQSAIVQPQNPHNEVVLLEQWFIGTGWVVPRKTVPDSFDHNIFVGGVKEQNYLTIRKLRQELIHRINHKWGGRSPKISPLWLPPLPRTIHAAEMAQELHKMQRLRHQNLETLSQLPTIPLGLVDHPASQLQYVEYFFPERDGNLLISGYPQTGKTYFIEEIYSYLTEREIPVTQFAPTSDEEFQETLHRISTETRPQYVLMDDFDLLQEQFEFSLGLQNAFQQLSRMIQRSPENGCHFIITSSARVNIQQKLLERFRQRLLLGGELEDEVNKNQFHTVTEVTTSPNSWNQQPPVGRGRLLGGSGHEIQIFTSLKNIPWFEADKKVDYRYEQNTRYGRQRISSTGFS